MFHFASKVCLPLNRLQSLPQTSATNRVPPRAGCLGLSCHPPAAAHMLACVSSLEECAHNILAISARSFSERQISRGSPLMVDDR